MGAFKRTKGACSQAPRAYQGAWCSQKGREHPKTARSALPGALPLEARFRAWERGGALPITLPMLDPYSTPNERLWAMWREQELVNSRDGYQKGL